VPSLGAPLGAELGPELGCHKFGHCDSWKIDALQLLVKRNHRFLLYPDWSNASDYKETAESFGTVALHSAELHAALGQVELADDVSANFTGEMILVWGHGSRSSMSAYPRRSHGGKTFHASCT
jgi:alpha-ketoglutarate-dependent taurine dioxygenase